jgi:hypothetical protein
LIPENRECGDPKKPPPNRDFEGLGEFTLHRISVSLESSSPFSLKQINFLVKKRKRNEKKEIEVLLFVLSSSSFKSSVFGTFETHPFQKPVLIVNN